MVAGANAPGGCASIAPAVTMAIVVVVVLRARGKIEVHKMGYGRLSLSIAERTHGQLSCSVQSTCARRVGTYRLSNGILVGLPKLFRALVLLLGRLAVPRGRRVLERESTSLLAEEVRCRRDRLVLRGRLWCCGCRGFRGRGGRGWVRRHDATRTRGSQ